MNTTQWAHRLADINEAIFDTEKALANARMQVDLIQYDLDHAERGSSMISLEGKLKYWQSRVQKHEKELERYKKYLKEHYEIEPKG